MIAGSAMAGGAAVAMLWAVVVAWLIRRALRQYGCYQQLEPEPIQRVLDLPAVGVVVPARNEADAIAACVEGLAAQDYPRERQRIVLVDDASSDGTAALAAAIAAGDPRFEIMAAGPLPAGWTGKCHACWQGAQCLDAPWLCFIDADTMPSPGLLRGAVTHATRGGIDFLSLEPRQELVTPWERMIIPAGLCALGFAGDLHRPADRQPGGASVNGQFILLRRSLYDRVGGHRAVCSEIAEDTALATRARALGARVALMSGAPLIAVRMYRSLPQLWEGLAKNVTETFGGTRRTALVVGLGLMLAWASILVPAALALALVPSGASPLLLAALAVALLASAAVFGFHVAAARYFAVPLRYGLAFPLGYTLAALLAIDGMMARRRGRIRWKGRIYGADRERPAGAATRR